MTDPDQIHGPICNVTQWAGWGTGKVTAENAGKARNSDGRDGDLHFSSSSHVRVMRKEESVRGDSGTADATPQMGGTAKGKWKRRSRR